MKIVVTGGVGFIGANLCRRLATAGNSVLAVDNLSRQGTVRNLAWLKENLGSAFSFVEGDVRDHKLLAEVFPKSDVVLHCAGQVAVTTSIADPVTDFEINARGTLNVLEAVRRHCPGAVVGLASTNKVYGKMDQVRISRNGERYFYVNRPEGIPEEQPLDFHSPYGCSKGAADQYVRDYQRIYGLKTFVFRQSCIYGPMQYGCEDQGWVAHFLKAALLKKTLVIYGDGAQVRDVLYIDDLSDAFERAIERAERIAGQVFNIGGGPCNTLSLLELLDWMRAKLGYASEVSFQNWRPGDQQVYISDVGKAERLLDWRPHVSPAAGLAGMVQWYRENGF